MDLKHLENHIVGQLKVFLIQQIATAYLLSDTTANNFGTYFSLSFNRIISPLAERTIS